MVEHGEPRRPGKALHHSDGAFSTERLQSNVKTEKHAVEMEEKRNVFHPCVPCSLLYVSCILHHFSRTPPCEQVLAGDRTILYSSFVGKSAIKRHE